MREKKGGALSKVQKLKRRISSSFGKLGENTIYVNEGLHSEFFGDLESTFRKKYLVSIIFITNFIFILHEADNLTCI